MKATDLLEKQHREVERLFDSIEKAKGRVAKRKLFDELAASLVAHDAIEREIFYPACEKKMGKTDDLGEALAEHGVVEFCVFRADTARTDDDFDACVTVLQESLDHHVKEEENEFFPKASRALGAEMLEKLGAKMEDRFESAMEADFRIALQKNLGQVLQGAVKTSRRGLGKKTAAKKKTKAAAARKK
jgi:hemerythrin-like domain-containing protein